LAAQTGNASPRQRSLQFYAWNAIGESEIPMAWSSAGLRVSGVALATKLAVLFLSGAALAEQHEELFQQIKTHMSEHLSKLPNYTCHETIERTLRIGSDWRHLDTVELEVAFVGQKEIFAQPGQEKFDEQSVERLVKGGTIGNNALGSHIDLIFTQDVAEFRYAGACKKDGRKAIRYDLRVPIEKSRFLVRHDGAVSVAGYEGSVWVDAETLDPVRVDFKVNQIPSSLGVRLIEESLHYKKRTIGNSEFDLPDHSELAATDEKGNYSLNIIKIDRCREFTGDSVIKYGEPSQGTAARSGQDH
jgi:hypothetical protein